MALSLLASPSAFSGAAIRAAPANSVAATMFSDGDIGVTPPLGVWDPLGLIEKRDMRRYEIMEIKHGRSAMLGFVHILAIHAGVRLPGYLSQAAGLKFADMPVGCFASLEATPTAGWLQIMIVTAMAETGAGNVPDLPGPSGLAGGPTGLVKAGLLGQPQTADKAPGDIGGEIWQRYADP